MITDYIERLGLWAAGVMIFFSFLHFETENVCPDMQKHLFQESLGGSIPSVRPCSLSRCLFLLIHYQSSWPHHHASLPVSYILPVHARCFETVGFECSVYAI